MKHEGRRGVESTVFDENFEKLWGAYKGGVPESQTERFREVLKTLYWAGVMECHSKMTHALIQIFEEEPPQEVMGLISFVSQQIEQYLVTSKNVKIVRLPAEGETRH